MLHRLIKPALLLGLLLIGNPAHAQGSTIRQGMLTCRTSASLGLIVGSNSKARVPIQREHWLDPGLRRQNKPYWPGYRLHCRGCHGMGCSWQFKRNTAWGTHGPLCRCKR